MLEKAGFRLEWENFITNNGLWGGIADYPGHPGVAEERTGMQLNRKSILVVTVFCFCVKGRRDRISLTIFWEG